ncbi:DIP1281 family NlpC/P60 protein [Corynebacterium meitnerae]|uniref:NlpC/P60 family protein n=1 Tax=Corynebacterium meitnerae TaxID=2913498 RepID=A0A9X3LUI4_9CORY|nr:NlpC/P60 family protein [Corynebacterium meitnerae]
MGFTVRTHRRFRGLIPAAACAVSLSIVSSTTSVAQESPVTALVSSITDIEADINRINLEIGGLQEAVNQALVDLHDAQSLAEQARQGAQEAKNRLNASQADVDRAQDELNAVSRSSYRAQNSASPAQMGSGDARKDSLDRQTYLRRESDEKRNALEELVRNRTIAANDESTLRQASRLADERERQATQAEVDARGTLENAVTELVDKSAARDAAVADLETAQNELAELRPEHPLVDDTPEIATPAPAPAPEELAESAEETSEATTEPSAESTPAPAAESEPETETSAPAQESAPAPAQQDTQQAVVDAAINALAEAVGESQAEHAMLENPYGNGGASESIAATSGNQNANDAVAETDAEAGTNVADVLPEVKDSASVSEEIREDSSAAAANGSRQQQIEAVIARAESQIGTPYVWGGGDANGPTAGISDGRNPRTGQLGYDCSGLVLYAFAGVGISLPHYTGYQYQRGEKIPVAQAERGDLLFWGEGGSRHVAIYLGNGQMLEAPQTGMNVQKTAVRQSGMAPYAVRLI